MRLKQLPKRMSLQLTRDTVEALRLLPQVTGHPTATLLRLLLAVILHRHLTATLLHPREVTVVAPLAAIKKDKALLNFRLKFFTTSTITTTSPPSI